MQNAAQNLSHALAVFRHLDLGQQPAGQFQRYQVFGQLLDHGLVANGARRRLKDEAQVEVERVPGVDLVLDPDRIAQDFGAKH